jgi:hypothetical protein
MKRIIAYLLVFLGALVYVLTLDLQGLLPAWLTAAQLPFRCVLAGGFGGAVYCLRGIYLNACVRKQWDGCWWPWYYIRPWVSLVCGGVSFVFLKAGLLLLESTGPRPDATQLGYLALAFIAGLNVDKFMAKVEDIAQATWGIERSRVAREKLDEPKSE